jgi:molybdopterin/thiamine biosynthesis adenylyltransferase
MAHHARYDRLVAHPDIGEAGLEKLRACKVAIVGVGGLGTAVAVQLAMAGIGALTLIDDDKVHASNLNRQLLFGPGDIGFEKSLQAAKKIHQLNPDVDCKAVNDRLSRKNAKEYLSGHDILLDCTDRPTARYYISEAAESLNVPWIFAGIHGNQGMMATFSPHQKPSFGDLFPAEKPWFGQDCDNSGVLGMVTTLMGTLQAKEALSLCIQPEKIKSGTLVLFDWDRGTVMHIK